MTLRAEGRRTFIAPLHYNVSFKQIHMQTFVECLLCQALDILYSTHIFMRFTMNQRV